MSVYFAFYPARWIITGSRSIHLTRENHYRHPYRMIFQNNVIVLLRFQPYACTQIFEFLTTKIKNTHFWLEEFYKMDCFSQEEAMFAAFIFFHSL